MTDRFAATEASLLTQKTTARALVALLGLLVAASDELPNGSV